MILKFDYLNKFSERSNPGRDWSLLLGGFFLLVILVVILNLTLNWYIKTTISYSLQNTPPVPSTINQKALAKTLEVITLRELEHKENLTKPKTFSDPSL